MRNGVTQLSFNGFVGEQTQGPAVVSFGRIATGQSRDFGALETIDLNRATRTGRITKTVQAVRGVAFTPSSNGVVIDTERMCDRVERLTAIKVEQGGRTFEGFSAQGTFGKQCFQRPSVGICKGYGVFLHTRVYTIHLQNATRL